MTKFMLIALAASLSIVNPESARPQAAIQEPGAYAFYHPDGDLLRAGPSQYGPRSVPYGAVGAPYATALAPTIGRPARGHRQGRMR